MPARSIVLKICLDGDHLQAFKLILKNSPHCKLVQRGTFDLFVIVSLNK